jgi:magnesium-transporting ATPase (P-type)
MSAQRFPYIDKSFIIHSHKKSTMNGEITFGYAVLIWLIRFAVVILLAGAGVYGFFIANLAVALFAGVVANRVSRRKIKPDFLTTAVWLGIIWSVVNIVLDAIVGRHFYPDILNSWIVWIGYLLIFLAPVVHRQQHHKRTLKANPRYHP